MIGAATGWREPSDVESNDVTELPATELLDWSGEGRCFEARRTVRLGDVDPLGEIRLDAIARYLQDVASDDAIDAGLPNALGWVVRRTKLRVDAPAHTGDEVELRTFCTGAGRAWAERRTTIRSPGGASIDAVSLWVQVDVDTGRPARLGDEFAAIYGPAARGRQVSSKLSLPTRPPADVVRSVTWRFRAADRDQFGHVNNAAQLALVEERLAPGARRGAFVVEYLSAADAGVDYSVAASDGTVWLSPPGDGAPVTVFAVEP